MNNNLQSEQTAEQEPGLVLSKACDRAVLCHLSFIFSVYIYTESIMREYDELSVVGTNITELRYADDTTLFATTPQGLNNIVQALNNMQYLPVDMW